MGIEKYPDWKQLVAKADTKLLRGEPGGDLSPTTDIDDEKVEDSSDRSSFRSSSLNSDDFEIDNMKHPESLASKFIS